MQSVTLILTKNETIQRYYTRYDRMRHDARCVIILHLRQLKNFSDTDQKLSANSRYSTNKKTCTSSTVLCFSDLVKISSSRKVKYRSTFDAIRHL